MSARRDEPGANHRDTIMGRNITSRSSARSLLVAAALVLGALTSFSQPTRAFASFSGADRQEQPAAASEPAAVTAAPAGPSAATIARQRQAAKQQAMRAGMARQQAMRAGMARQQAAEESRRARRRAFVGGLLIGVLAARRR